MDEKKFEDLKFRIFDMCRLSEKLHGDKSTPYDDGETTKHSVGFSMYSQVDTFVRNLRDYYVISEGQYDDLMVRIHEVRKLYLGV